MSVREIFEGSPFVRKNLNFRKRNLVVLHWGTNINLLNVSFIERRRANAFAVLFAKISFWIKSIQRPFVDGGTVDKQRKEWSVRDSESHHWLREKKCHNTIQDGSFRGCSGMGGQKGLLPKICLTYHTMMKLGTDISYQKKIQKM